MVAHKGQHLYVRECGLGQDPVLLLHGLNESAEGYGPAIRYLEPRFRIFALDFRGHGRSQWGSRYQLSDYVTDAVSVIEDRIGEPVVSSQGIPWEAWLLRGSRYCSRAE